MIIGNTTLFNQNTRVRNLNKHEKQILRFANQLMKPLKKYGDSKIGSDFSSAKTPRQKAQVIKIWIGEIIADAIAEQDPPGLKSLVETIGTEIEELIKQ
jgi:hypothetical protein